MKFHFFHLMPYPNLPADFRDKYRSVWVDVPSALFDPEAGNRAYNEYLDELEYAETRRLRRHLRQRASPERLWADAVAQSDGGGAGAADPARQAGGDGQFGRALQSADPRRRGDGDARLDVGRPARRRLPGRHAAWTRSLPMASRPRTLREKYREGVELVLRAWREPEACSPSTANIPSCATSMSGRGRCSSRTRRCGSRAAPASRPGTGASTTTSSTPTCPISAIRRRRRCIDGFWASGRAPQGEPNPYRAGFLQFVAVADSDAEAERLYAEPALYFYSHCLHVYARLRQPAGLHLARHDPGRHREAGRAHRPPRRVARRAREPGLEGYHRRAATSSPAAPTRWSTGSTTSPTSCMSGT